MNNLILLGEGLRMFRRRLKVYRKGLKRYSGNNDIEICKQIVADCYDKEEKFFRTSKGHLCQYWTRDFGLCVESLKNLRYKKEIENTIIYALDKFVEHGSITTAITPNGKPFNYPTFAPDSLAFTLHSLIIIDNKKIISRYKDFLEAEAKKYHEIVIHKKTGLVNKRHFSSIRDQTITKSSCYNNIMAAWVSKNLDKLDFENPLKDYNFKKIIKKYFWTGEYFIDDLSGKKIISADANTFPFWTGIFESRDMIKSAVQSIRRRKLDKPFPVNYSIEKPKLEWRAIFAQGYEDKSVWPHVGMPFIENVSKIEKELAKKYLHKYKQLIEGYQNFLEVYNLNGRPYKNFFYYCDEGMLWASMYLELKKRIK